MSNNNNDKVILQLNKLSSHSSLFQVFMLLKARVNKQVGKK